ncbi:MAG: S41 family peptidase, partial [Proteobacteria bacterium]|nr:S41 family peptidase [Pseudomonadota bacterium]
MKKYINTALYLLLLTSYSMVIHAQGVPNQLTKKEISEVIKSVSQLLNSKYVYPDKAKNITNLLNKNYKKGVYSKITNELIFAEKIQEDILSVVNDSHLMFEFNPEQVKELRIQQDENIDSGAIKTRLREMQRFNFGFETVEILEGNIGYLKLNSFYDTKYASETAVAAMNFLSNADSIIIDLRQNGGGSWKMIQLISSYLFEPDPVHLSGFYWRPEDKYTQNWT